MTAEHLLMICLYAWVAIIKAQPLPQYECLYDMIQKQVDLGNNLTQILDRLKQLEQQVNNLSLEVSGIPKWNQWTEWSGCILNCTGPSGGRLQTRSRTAIASMQSGSDTKPETQSESRPCNAVQFAGCVKSSNSADDEYAVVYDYQDMIAQATCSALGSGYIRAIKRICSGPQSCEDVCAAVGTQCFNALHVYGRQPVPKREEYGTRAMKTYKYNSCSGVFCGPNYCCCQGA